MMAKLMWICGILLIAAGIATGIVLFVSAAPPAGIDIQTAAILLVGGVLALGLGGVIDGQGRVTERHPARALVPEPVIPAAATAAAAAVIPEFDPRSAKAAAVAAEAPVATMADEEVSRPTRETIEALEQARQKIEQAFDTRASQPAEAPISASAEPEPEAAAEEVTDEVVEDVVIEEETVAEEEVAEEGLLYVVEERIIRRHPARILSDGTVEAETAEGWMRFENLEHLDEYLDAMEPARG
jgi:hypothetical protein